MASCENPFLLEIIGKYDFLQRLNLLDQDFQKTWKECTAASSKYLKWTTGQKDVAVTSDNENDIPDGILPNGRQGKLYDIRVKSPRGADDAIYDASEDLRKMVARGNTILKIFDGPQLGSCMAIHALKKFTGGELFDDDDRADQIQSNENSATCHENKQESWQLYFKKPVDEAKIVISTRKANGEAAHLSCVRVEGVPIIICGSKNTHMAVRTMDDINQYIDKPRFKVACVIARAIFKELDRLSEDQRISLLEFLMLTRFTAVFEILCRDHQHVENFSHMRRDELKFITWTSTDYESTDLVAVPPHTGIEIARCFGLDTTTYEEVCIADLQKHRDKVRQSYGHEGDVLYYLDNNHATIGLIKLKTTWYILCRAIREKSKTACSRLRSKKFKSSSQATIIQSVQDKMGARLKEIQKWLDLTEDVVALWKHLANGFIAFCVKEVSSDSYSLEEVANLYPLLWNRYLKEAGLDDRIVCSSAN